MTQMAVAFHPPDTDLEIDVSHPGAVPAGQLPDPCDALLATLGDHLGGAELAAELGALLVPAHEQDLVGAQPPGGQDR